MRIEYSVSMDVSKWALIALDDHSDIPWAIAYDDPRLYEFKKPEFDYELKYHFYGHSRLPAAPEEMKQKQGDRFVELREKF